MEWSDDGIVLGTRRHGESSAILELMTREHGRHLELVRGGSGSRMRPVLQPGNLVRVLWRARLDEHLGHYTVDGLNLRAGALLSTSYAVYAVTHLAGLARLLPERDPHESVFDALDAILDRLDTPLEAAANVVRFELDLLSELGFGLDLELLCRDRFGARADLRLAQIGPGGVAGCWRAMARQAVSNSGVPRNTGIYGAIGRRTGGRVRDDRIFSGAAGDRTARPDFAGRAVSFHCGSAQNTAAGSLKRQLIAAASPVAAARTTCSHRTADGDDAGNNDNGRRDVKRRCNHDGRSTNDRTVRVPDAKAIVPDLLNTFVGDTAGGVSDRRSGNRSGDRCT